MQRATDVECGDCVGFLRVGQAQAGPHEVHASVTSDADACGQGGDDKEPPSALVARVAEHLRDDGTRDWTLVDDKQNDLTGSQRNAEERGTCVVAAVENDVANEF